MCDDKVMQEKLGEARTKLQSIMKEVVASGPTDKHVEEVMMYQKLVEEVESDE